MDATQSPTPFVAALFAGDRIAKPGNAMYHTSIPGSAAQANPLDLAPKLFAYTLLCLRDEGAIAFAEMSKKVLFVTTAWIHVTRTGKPTSATGLAARLFERIGDGKSAKDVVRAWFASDVYNPWGDTVAAATKEAIDAGYLVPEKQGAAASLGAKLTRFVATTVAPGREEELHKVAADAAQRWAGYQSREGALVDALVKQCGSGIGSRRNQMAAAGIEQIG